ncbi:hypothetical protein HII13_001025 [Brettanomyces bruxellensis]|nr:hypothetical protein HII13_001025 [Brettanomyces bruxellensis]
MLARCSAKRLTPYRFLLLKTSTKLHSIRFATSLRKTPTSLDDIYSKLREPVSTDKYVGDSFRLSSSVDNVLTPVNITAVQRWSLFTACLKSRDYERADLILQNLSTQSSVNNPYYQDGICEFLACWGQEENITIGAVRSWLNRMSSVNESFQKDPRVYAWMIRILFQKGEDAETAMKELAYYKLAAYGNKNSDVLRYINIVGVFNVKKLVTYDPNLRESIPDDYKDLFNILLSHPNYPTQSKVLETSNSDTISKEISQNEGITPKTEGGFEYKLSTEKTNKIENKDKKDNLQEHMVNKKALFEANKLVEGERDDNDLDVATIIKEAQQNVINIDKENKAIDNGIVELKSVSTWNLKAIRHSLLGLVDTYHQGKFIRQFIEAVEEANLDVDTDAVMKCANAGKQVNFFDIKESLPFEQREKFDEVLDEISEERQILLEGTTIEAAKAKWDHEFENLKDKSMPSSVGSYLHNWMEQLTPLIEKDVDEYEKAKIYFAALKAKKNVDRLSNYDEERYREKMKYGPFISLMKPEKVAIITILEVMKNCVTSDIARGVPVSKVVMSVSKSLELEYKSEKVLASDVDVYKNFRAIRKTPEFKRFLRSKQAEKIIRAAERKSLRNNSIETETSQLLWDADSHCRVGSALISMLLQIAKVDVEGVDPKTSEVKKALAPAFYHTYDFQNGGKVGVIKVNQRFSSKLGKDRLDQSIQAQYLPMIARPRPWTTYNDGGYYLKRCLVLRSKNAPEQFAYAKAAAMSGKMDKVLSGLNALGNTSWTVNKRILELMTQVWNTGKAFLEIPKAEEKLILPKPPAKGAEPIEIFRYRRDCRDKCNAFAKDRSMRCDMNYKLEIARAFLGERIFFPHSLDFRGRAYPIPPNFNHLGNDLTRGLLRFWVGKKLGADGLRWLKIHCCNLMGNDKISLDDRVKYTEEHMNEIIDSVEHPFDGKKFWVEADHPWQFLATAMELKDAMELPDPTQFVSHQPVHQDGTCNGLQHYAALGGDIEGAEHVNLVPNDKPSDIYTRVSKIVQQMVDEDAEKGVPDARRTQNIITRKLVKQTVMTSVYGVTYVGARAQIVKRLKEIDFDEDHLSDCSAYLTDKVLKAIRKLFDGAHAIQDWLALAAKRISKSIRLDIDVNDDTEYISSVIWTSPLGLPVVQPYRKFKSRQIHTNLQTMVINDPYEIKKVDARKQAQGFPPNFVHSLDATHMLMSVNRCREHGLSFSSVHDSYWTHAANITLMNKILREEFVKLHKNDLVSKLRSEFMKRYGDNVLIIEVPKNSKVANAVKAYRAAMSKKLGRTISLKDEINIERERRNLLHSKDPSQVKLGQELKSPLEIFRETEYNMDRDEKGTFRILAPFDLPPVPPRGSFDVSIVKQSQYFFS